MNELRPESRALFKGTREDFEPRPQDRDRIKRKIALQIGAAAVATTVASTSAATGGATAGAVSSILAWTKGIVGIGLVVGLGVAGLAAYHARAGAHADSVPAPVASPSTKAEVVAVVPAVEPTIPAAEPTIPAAESTIPVAEAALSTASAARPRPAPVPVPSVAKGSVADEARLLRDADAALRDGDPATALALLDQHQRAHPRGVLAEERTAERVLALCKAGRVTEARAQAARFLNASPNSPLASRVRAACAGGKGAP